MIQTLQAHPGKVPSACGEKFDAHLSCLNLQRISWSIRAHEFSSIWLHGFLNLALAVENISTVSCSRCTSERFTGQSEICVRVSLQETDRVELRKSRNIRKKFERHQ
jgi:hypothetical protein